MKISLIVAIAKNNAIGLNNDLLWRLPNDMKYFKEITSGHHIITGRKNYISIPQKFRPLPNRTNLVLTRQVDFSDEGSFIFNDLESAIDFAKSNNETELFIIGGGQIYKEALDKNLIDKMYITHVHHLFEADTFFPEIDQTVWKEINSESHQIDEKHPYSYSFVVYEKMN
ncbi:dihydrofolate reductase [Vicingus serpentipes]|uniref:Dihydrofolate reductase n=1 Tax=Vicingus serpentipes TaxID=1926625 RepID=A0A5C6RXX9_9FLAO|nr:dihydrofolate reductase [Vicingus serpentipes]TXB67033.1 dihydrofolate reductase [Vicingus serpentipes]